jgi:hypothetical protein
MKTQTNVMGCMVTRLDESVEFELGLDLKIAISHVASLLREKCEIADQ